MPTKINRAGKQQNYIPAGNGDASGEYTDHAGAGQGAQQQAPQSFNAINQMRTGKASMPKEEVKEAAKPKPKNLKEWENHIFNNKKDKPPFNPMKMSSKESPIQKVDSKTIQMNLISPDFAGYQDLEEVTNKAAALIQKYELNIDNASQLLENLASQNGGVMVGLEYRLKSLNSLTRKIYKEVAEHRADGLKDYSYDDAIAGMKDVGRFTMVFDKENFAQGVTKALDTLESQGYRITKFKNTFKEGEPYKGLNCNFVDKNGVTYELQFHIPESMKVKEGIEVDVGKRSAYINKNIFTSHDIYETVRDIDKEIADGSATPERIKLKADLEARSKAWWSKVPNIALDRQLK